jgi:hypothetical protein
VTLTIPPAGLSQDILMTQGWDLAGDFNTAANHSGVWTYAYDQGTFTPMPNYYDGWGAAWTHSWTGGAAQVGQCGVWTHNASWNTRSKEHVYRGVWEPWKVLVSPTREFAYDGNTAYTGRKAVARFISPTSGYYDVDVVWTARTDHDTSYIYNYGGGVTAPGVDGTTSTVTLKKNDAEVYSGQLNGYVGTATSGYTDSFGSARILTYSTVYSLTQGDIIDVVVGGDNSGWTGVDFTVSAKSAAYIYGTVTSDRTGNPPVKEATITAFGGTVTYSTTTDTAGKYWLMVQPGLEYEVQADKTGHASDSFVTVPDPGQGVSHDFSLHFKEEWDFAADFSSLYNPNTEWSYGYCEATSNRATFGLYTNVKTGVIGDPWYSAFKMWTTDGNMWAGGVGGNFTDNVMTAVDNGVLSWYVEPHQMIQYPGAQPPGQDWVVGKLSTVRWTAPKDMVINIDATWTSQYPPAHLHSGSVYYPMYVAAYKNGSAITAPVMDGFAGRHINGYADSIGPNPKVSFQTALPVNSGDTIDFSYPNFSLQTIVAFGLDAKIKAGSGIAVTSIAQIKAQPDDTTVFMNTPIQLSCSTNYTGSFARQYGTATPENCFFVQTDDRLQGLRCVVPAGGLPTLDANNKVTFSGVVDTDYLDQKIVKVGSINSTATSTAPTPFGKGSKSLTNSGTLVRVWGKIVSLTPNPHPVLWQDTGGNWWPDYAYEYVTINDGGADIKIPLHLQYELVSTYDTWVNDLSVGDYLGVTGIASTSTGADAVVIPRTAGDITNYSNVSP